MNSFAFKTFQQKAISCHFLFILVKLLEDSLTTVIKHMVGNPFINGTEEKKIMQQPTELELRRKTMTVTYM